MYESMMSLNIEKGRFYSTFWHAFPCHYLKCDSFGNGMQVRRGLAIEYFEYNIVFRTFPLQIFTVFHEQTTVVIFIVLLVVWAYLLLCFTFEYKKIKIDREHTVQPKLDRSDSVLFSRVRPAIQYRSSTGRLVGGEGSFRLHVGFSPRLLPPGDVVNGNSAD